MFRDSLSYLKSTIVQPSTANFNKIINLKFQTSNGQSFEVKTPKKGYKPDIEISGSFSPNGFAENFEIRVKNLYIDGLNADLTTVEVSAGYEDKISLGIFGSVTNCYTATPSPDKETVIQCTTAQAETWNTSTINLNLSEGFTLSEAITQISNNLEYDTPNIDSSIATLTSNAPFFFNGKCSDALNQLKKYFPTMCVETDGKRIRIFSTKSKMKTTLTHTLKIFTQAPQFSGGVVSLSIPFNPMIHCGDYVKFSSNFSSTSIGSLNYNTAQVNTIQFSFGTVSDTNEMILTCTPLAS